MKRTDNVKENSESVSAAPASEAGETNLDRRVCTHPDCHVCRVLKPILGEISVETYPVGRLLRDEWLALRDDGTMSVRAKACIEFAYGLGLLSPAQYELWCRRITTCPGHDDEGGRDWCAYCGKMPVEKSS